MLGRVPARYPSYTTSRSLASIWLPAWTRTSAILPSRSAWSAVSIFIASIESSTSPACDLLAGVDGERRDDARHRRGDVVGVALLGLAADRDLPGQPVRHLGDARLAVQLEEDADEAVLVGLADRLVADDQRLALLDLDQDLLADRQAVEIDRRRQHRDRAVGGRRPWRTR